MDPLREGIAPVRPKMRRGIGNRKGPQVKPADLEAAVMRKARRRRALELAVIGLTRRQIARELGISLAQAIRDVSRELAAPNEGTDNHRALLVARHERELTHLETVGRQLFKLAVPEPTAANPSPKPDLEAAAALVRISAAKAKHLTALAHLQVPPSPQRHEHTGAEGGPIEVHDRSDEILGRLSRLSASGGEEAGDREPVTH